MDIVVTSDTAVARIHTETTNPQTDIMLLFIYTVTEVAWLFPKSTPPACSAPVSDHTLTHTLSPPSSSQCPLSRH